MDPFDTGVNFTGAYAGANAGANAGDTDDTYDALVMLTTSRVGVTWVGRQTPPTRHLLEVGQCN